MQRLIRYFIFNKRGSALVEFALVTPLLLTLFFGVVELTRFIVIMQKVERASYSLSNIIIQYLPAQEPAVNVLGEISEGNMNNSVFPQLSNIMNPNNAAGDLRAIATSVVNPAATAPPVVTINWQMVGGGTLTNADTFSIVNGLAPSAINSSVRDTAATFTPEIMADLANITQGENIIVVEVFYNYQPLVSDILVRFGMPSLAQRTIVSRVYSMPRQGNLLALPPSFPVATP